MYTKWGANNTIDYDWLGVQSEQHLTTVLIESGLTKDILLDEIGEMEKEKRWEHAYPTTQKMIFHNAGMKSLDIYNLDCFFHNQLFNLSLHTCISKCIHHRNRSQSRAYKTVVLYYNAQTFSFIRSGSSNCLALSINKMCQRRNNRLNKHNPHTASLRIACHSLSCPIIMRLTNSSLSIFLKDVLAMKQFEAQGPPINV